MRECTLYRHECLTRKYTARNDIRDSGGVSSIYFTLILRFSDKIDRMKNSYRDFFAQSQSRKDFLARGKNVSSNQNQLSIENQLICKAFMLLLALLQCLFTECRVSTKLLPFSCKLAINHRQWPKVRTG